MKKILFSISFLLIGIFTLNAQQYSEIYLVGDACSNGYNVPSTIAMTPDATNANIFTWKGELSEGSLKFATFESNDWCGGVWILATVAEQSITNSSYNTYDGCPDGATDLKWKVQAAEAGYYKITINLTAQTVVFESISDTPYNNLYLVGTAVDGDWDLGKAVSMVKDDKNDFLFTYEGALQAGDFKIATELSLDAGYDWLHPSDENQTLCGTTYEIIENGTGGTDYKWSVQDEATYKITIDLANETFMLGVPYTKVFGVGSALSTDWDLAASPYFTRDAENPFLFTWQGELSEGEIKFGTIKNFEGGDWLYATTANQALTATDYDLRAAKSGDDNKWLVGANDVGNYTITINFYEETLTFTKDQTTSINEISEKKLLKNTVVENELILSLSALRLGAANTKANYTIYNLTGAKVKSGIFNSDRINVNKISSGLYILKINSLNKNYTEKFYKK